MNSPYRLSGGDLIDKLIEKGCNTIHFTCNYSV